MSRKLQIAYIFTTFPAKSETFLQREVECLSQENVYLKLFSLWGGQKEFKGMKVKKFNRMELLFFPIWLVWALIRHPQNSIQGLRTIIKTKPKSLLNIGENLVGLAFGLRYANYFKKSGIQQIHAPWATMPAAAVVLSKITKIPYSMGAHAYDIFKKNGDTYLRQKVEHSCFVHTSSNNAALRLIDLGSDPRKIVLIRRGLTTMPNMKKVSPKRSVLNIISIGRLVKKKGFLHQLEIYDQLNNRGFKFHARIIGAGSMRREILRKIDRLGLNNQVQLLPWMPYDKLEKLHSWADIFLFTGKIARDGDRDGLPNVIPEAMAKGIAVVTSNVAAIPEVIKNGKNGILIEDYGNIERWCDAIEKIGNEDHLYLALINEARKWVEANYDGKLNAKKLLNHFKKNIR